MLHPDGLRNFSRHWRKDWPASLEKGGSESNDLFDLKPGIKPPEVGGIDWHELAKQASMRASSSIASRRSSRR